jgi:hypothetical protein
VFRRCAGSAPRRGKLTGAAVATPRQSQAVSREQRVRAVERARDPRHARQPYEPLEAERRVDAPKHFHPGDELTVSGAAVDPRHQRRRFQPEAARVEVGGRDVGEAQPTLAIASPEHRDFARAERAFAVEEHLELGARFRGRTAAALPGLYAICQSFV